MRDFTNVYHSEDKTLWGPGPWQDEPDKATWIDTATGLDCMVRRGMGAWCGYVGVPPGHPWHHKGYDECVRPDVCKASDDDWHYECSPQGVVEVHGGLTFSGECHEGGKPESAICHVPQPGRPADVTWFGFDCSHAWDLDPSMAKYGMRDGTYRDLAYVVAETERLAAQLAEVPA